MCLCIRATSIRCLFRLEEPFFLLDNERCVFLSWCSDLRKNFGGGICSPVLVVINELSPTSIPMDWLLGGSGILSTSHTKVTYH